MKHAEVRLEWADCILTLVSHHSRQLMQMIKIMHRPRGQKF
jgi:hypothetical protein